MPTTCIPVPRPPAWPYACGLLQPLRAQRHPSRIAGFFCRGVNSFALDQAAGVRTIMDPSVTGGTHRHVCESEGVGRRVTAQHCAGAHLPLALQVQRQVLAVRAQQANLAGEGGRTRAQGNIQGEGGHKERTETDTRRRTCINRVSTKPSGPNRPT